MQGKPLVSGINLHKLSEVTLALLLSPLLGYVLAAALLLLSKRWFPDPSLHRPPSTTSSPSKWVRGLLVTTCTGVSFAHGSNDGQKGMGLVMLILIGMMPVEFALNRDTSLLHVADSLHEVRSVLGPTGSQPVSAPHWALVAPELSAVESLLAGKSSVNQLPTQSRWTVRVELLKIQNWLSDVRKSAEYKGNPQLVAAKKGIADAVEYVPFWVILCVALSLGLGTTIGWQRIVVTVGEKIGKSHLTYSQGAAAELVAMGTIGIASFSGLPVSTTHVLSSGVAGTMWANRSGLNFSTVKQIAAAWVLTLPATMLLACGFFALGRTLLA